DVSRIRFGKVQLKRAPIDLREVARDAVATSDPVLAAAHHRLSMELGHEPVWVDADRVRLAQVISNLLNNAARYTPAGGHIRLEIAGDESEAGIVVDDNVDAASTQAALLRILGHEVEVAYDGEAALEKAREFRPEIVLLDLGMPGMDGFEVARRLRASKEGRRVKLVAQTGWGQEE